MQPLYDPDVVWDMSQWEGFPEQSVYRGRDGLEQVMELLHGDVGVLVNEPVQVVAVGKGRVFVEGRMVVRGASSGIEVDPPPFGQIIEFREELISRVDNYSDLADARGAAGLPSA